jgi:hypothetical protein
VEHPLVAVHDQLVGARDEGDLLVGWLVGWLVGCWHAAKWQSQQSRQAALDQSDVGGVPRPPTYVRAVVGSVPKRCPPSSAQRTLLLEQKALATSPPNR